MNQLVLYGLAVIRAALGSGGAPTGEPPGYVPALSARAGDSLRAKKTESGARTGAAALAWGAVVPGYLSARGLPPVRAQVVVTDTGLVFHAADGSATLLPLVGPMRNSGGRQWRPATVSLAYVDQTHGSSVYVFRVDAGVFETDEPGPLLDVAAHPVWLDSLRSTHWPTEQGLVSGSDSAALWKTAWTVATGAYADSLYALFGRPQARVGLIGRRGRDAGRLGEYVASRDSLALDPARMVGEAQLRHTLAHELGHRWQMKSKARLRTLWSGVPPIRDPKRYGFGDPAEHQAEAIAFAVNFLQVTASSAEEPATLLALLDHYELLVPGTRAMVRHFSLHPLYRNHPLRAWLIRRPQLS